MNCELLRSALVPAAAYGVRGEFELAGLLARSAVYDKMSPPTGKEKLVTSKSERATRECHWKQWTAVENWSQSGNVI